MKWMLEKQTQFRMRLRQLLDFFRVDDKVSPSVMADTMIRAGEALGDAMRGGPEKAESLQYEMERMRRDREVHEYIENVQRCTMSGAFVPLKPAIYDYLGIEPPKLPERLRQQAPEKIVNTKLDVGPNGGQKMEPAKLQTEYVRGPSFKLPDVDLKIKAANVVPKGVFVRDDSYRGDQVAVMMDGVFTPFGQKSVFTKTPEDLPPEAYEVLPDAIADPPPALDEEEQRKQTELEFFKNSNH